MNSLLQYSRTESSLLCLVWCCLLITSLLLLLGFPVLWSRLNMCLFVMTPLFDLCPSYTVVHIRSYLAPVSFLLYRLDPDIVSIDRLKLVHGPDPLPQQPPQ